MRQRASASTSSYLSRVWQWQREDGHGFNTPATPATVEAMADIAPLASAAAAVVGVGRRRRLRAVRRVELLPPRRRRCAQRQLLLLVLFQESNLKEPSDHRVVIAIITLRQNLKIGLHELAPAARRNLDVRSRNIVLNLLQIYPLTVTLFTVTPNLQ